MGDYAGAAADHALGSIDVLEIPDEIEIIGQAESLLSLLGGL
jgi:hypothetical protein